jgi:hypothetical protein
METKALVVRGKEIGILEIETIREILTAFPHCNRSAISLQVCEKLGWRQPNGKPQDVACREILRTLERQELIRLPAALTRSPNQIKQDRISCVEAEEFSFPPVAIEGSVGDVAAVSLTLVEGRTPAKMFAELMSRHHYLGYQWSVGRSVKYLFRMGEDVVGGMSWGSGSWKVGCRDEWIGWDAQTRAKNLNGIACNLRFLIAPWVKVKNLASHLLSRAVKRLPEDWRRLYGVELYVLETFVDPSRFKGTCYKAANWTLLGQTKGSGKRGASYYKHGQVKDVYVMALTKDWRENLCMR